MRRKWWMWVVLVLFGSGMAWGEVASLAPGGSLQPFTSNVVTGPFRGQQHCFVCALVPDEPAVFVFSRRVDEPAARLLRTLNQMVRTHRTERMFCLYVLLGEPGTEHETALETQGEAFGNQNNAAFVPISVLADRRGPPGYGLSPKADVIVFITRGRKIIAMRPYEARQWDARAADALQADIQATLHLKS